MKIKLITLLSVVCCSCSNSDQKTKEELIRELSSPDRQSVKPLDVSLVAVCNTAKKSYPFAYQIANLDTVNVSCSIKGYNFDSKTVNSNKPDFSVLNLSLYPSALFEGALNHAPKNGVVLVVSCVEDDTHGDHQAHGTFHILESVDCSNKG